MYALTRGCLSSFCQEYTRGSAKILLGNVTCIEFPQAVGLVKVEPDAVKSFLMEANE